MYRILQGDWLDVLRTLPDESVHCVVTSPPYWGLRDYGTEGQLGLEPTPEEYIAKLVEGFREVRRVLRADGTCWLNLGDSYNGSGHKDMQVNSPKQMTNRGATSQRGTDVEGLKPKDLVGIPWMAAFALRSDGWYLRQDIIWSKKNPMPEPIRDRCGKAHEYIFLLSKSPKYYFDHEAIKEDAIGGTPGNKTHKGKTAYENGDKKMRTKVGLTEMGPVTKRNKRSVWTVSTKPYKGAHFATFPPDLILPCILAGTSEKGCCPKCGSPWKRVVDKQRVQRHELPTDHPDYRPGRYTRKSDGSDDYSNGGARAFCFSETLGWEPTCKCGNMEPVPCTVLDPFNGAGTTGVVSLRQGRSYLGLELNQEYIRLAEERIGASISETNETDDLDWLSTTEESPLESTTLSQ